jgi:hypothetical protein
MELVGSLLHSQVPATCPFLEPDWSSINILINIFVDVLIIKICTVWIRKFASVCVYCIYIYFLLQEYTDGSLFRISLPHLCSSPLGELLLFVRLVVPRAVFEED